MFDGVLDLQLINRIFGLELIMLVYQISRPQLLAIKGVGPNILLLSNFFYFIYFGQQIYHIQILELIHVFDFHQLAIAGWGCHV
jgi:hypothetical protein